MKTNSVSQVFLIAEREIRARLASKSFITMIAVILLAVIGSVLVSGFLSNKSADDVTMIAVTETDSSSFTQLDQPWISVTPATDEAAAEDLVASGDVEAAVFVDESVPSGVRVLVDTDVPSSVMQLLTLQPEVQFLTEGDGAGFDFVAYFLAISFGIVFFFTAMMFGNTLVQSVVEEKQSRIIEILISCVHPRTLLIGKVLGNSALALATVAAAVILASVGLLATGQDILLGELGSSLIWFGVLFVFGFLLIATLFATFSSLVSRQEDAASVTMPVTMLIMIPYMLVIFFFDNPVVLKVMSYVPFSAPVGMPMRLYYGDAAWWEPVASLLIIIVTTAVVAWIGAKIYEGSILRTGKRVKLSEALSK